MRTFAREGNQPQKEPSSSLARANTALRGPSHHANPLRRLQRTLGNRAVVRMLQTHAEMPLQRSTKWVGATVHEDLNLAEVILNGSPPITVHVLNGTMLKTFADAESAIKAPTISTSGSGSAWKAKVDTVPKQEGGDDETVLAPGPWSTTAPKDDIGAK